MKEDYKKTLSIVDSAIDELSRGEKLIVLCDGQWLGKLKEDHNLDDEVLQDVIEGVIDEIRQNIADNQ